MIPLSYARQMEKRAEDLVRESMLEFQQLLVSDKSEEWDMINVMPRADKALEWHFNVWPRSGSFEGIPIHGVMQFSSSFPQDPPHIHVMFKAKHPKLVYVHSQAVVQLEACSPARWQPTLAKLAILSVLRELGEMFDGFEVEDTRMVSQAKEVYDPWTMHSATNPQPPKGKPVPFASSYSQSQSRISVQNTLNSEWRDATIPDYEIDYAACYFQAHVVNSCAGVNDLCTIRIGWVVKDTYEDWQQGEPEMFVIANRLRYDPVSGAVISTSNLIHKRPFEVVKNDSLAVGFLTGDSVICSVDFQNRYFGFYINGHPVGRIAMPPGRKNYVLQPYVGLTPMSHVNLNLLPLPLVPPELDGFLSCRDYVHIDKGEYLWETCGQMDWAPLFKFGVKPADDSRVAQGLHSAVLNIFDYLTEKDIARARGTCRLFENVLMDVSGSIGYKSLLKCGHSGHSYTDCNLGLMFNMTHETSDKRQSLGEYRIRTVSFSDEFISEKYWKKGITHNSSREEFQYFLPLVIEKDREERVLSMLKRYIAPMIGGTYRPVPGYRLICNLMDACLVKLSTQWKMPDSLTSRMLKAMLTVWSSLHYMLLLLRKDETELICADADRRVMEFKGKPESRSRKYTPSLGYILSLLLVSEKYSYRNVSKEWWIEALARDVPTYVRKNPELVDQKAPKEKRLPITFNSALKLRKLGALQYWFNVVFSSKNDTDVMHEGKMRAYSSRLGAPAPSSVNDLTEVLDLVNESREWPEYLRLINVSVNNDTANAVMLQALNMAIKHKYFDPSKLPSGTAGGTSDYPPPSSTSRGSPSDPRGGPRSPRDTRTPRDSRGEDRRGGRTPRDYAGERGPPPSKRDRRGGDRGGGYDDDLPRRSGGRSGGRDDRRSRGGGGPAGRPERGGPRGGRGGDRGDPRSTRGGPPSSRGRGRGGPRGGGGRGDDRGGGYPGRDGRRPDYTPRDISEYAAQFYDPKAVTSLQEMPDFLLKGLGSSYVQSFNDLQKKIIPLMTNGKPLFCFAPPNSGKCTSAVLGALYRLYIKKEPAQAVIICPNAFRSVEVSNLTRSLGTSVPDLNVICPTRGLRALPDAEKYSRGRNVFILTPQMASILAQRDSETEQRMLISNLVGVYILDSDTSLGQVLYTQCFNFFRHVPTTIPASIFSNSWSKSLERIGKQILPDPATPVIDLRSSHLVNHWYAVTTVERKQELVIATAKLNPHRQGIIFVDRGSDARTLAEKLTKNECSAAALTEDAMKKEVGNMIASFVEAKLKYIVAAAEAPVHTLSKTGARVILNFNVRTFDEYCQRSALIPMTDPELGPLEVVSLITVDRAEFFDTLEEECEVNLIELDGRVDQGFRPLESEEDEAAA